MKKLTLFTFLISFASVTIAQSPPIILWKNSFGGLGEDYAKDCIMLNDTQLVVCGKTLSNEGLFSGNSGLTDGFYAQTDHVGNIEILRCFGGQLEDEITGALRLNDTLFYLLGNASSPFGGISSVYGQTDVNLLSVNIEGQIPQVLALGGPGEEIFKVVKQYNNGLAIGSNSNSQNFMIQNPLGDNDFWITMLDSNFQLIQQWNYGTNNKDFLYDMEIVPLRKRAFVGNSRQDIINDTIISNGDYDMYAVCTDTSGVVLWQRLYGGSGFDVAKKVKDIGSGNYIIMGETDSNDSIAAGNHGGRDHLILRTDTIGNIVWSKVIGGEGDDFITDAEFDPDGSGIIISGYSYSSTGDFSIHYGSTNFSDGIIYKIDFEGNIQWLKLIGGSNDDKVNSIEFIDGVRFLISGDTKSTDGDFTNNAGNTDAFMAMLSTDITIAAPQKESIKKASIFPNPANDFVNIVTHSNDNSIVSVTDISGKLIIQNQTNGNQSLGLNLNNLTKGLYLVRIEGVSGVEVYKLIKN